MILSKTISNNIDVANNFKHKSIAKKWFCGGGTCAENMVHYLAIKFHNGEERYFVLNGEDFEINLNDYFKQQSNA